MAVLLGIPEDALIETHVGVHFVDCVTQALVQPDPHWVCVVVCLVLDRQAVESKNREE